MCRDANCFNADTRSPHLCPACATVELLAHERDLELAEVEREYDAMPRFDATLAEWWEAALLGRIPTPAG